MRELDEIHAQFQKASSAQLGLVERRPRARTRLRYRETEGRFDFPRLADYTVVHQSLQLNVGGKEPGPHGFHQDCAGSLGGSN